MEIQIGNDKVVNRDNMMIKSSSVAKALEELKSLRTVSMIFIKLKAVITDFGDPESNSSPITMYVRDFDFIELPEEDSEYAKCKGIKIVNLVLTTLPIGLNAATAEIYYCIVASYENYKAGEDVLSNAIEYALTAEKHSQVEAAFPDSSVYAESCEVTSIVNKNCVTFLSDQVNKSEIDVEVKDFMLLEYHYNGRVFAVCGAQYVPNTMNHSIKLYAKDAPLQPFRFKVTPLLIGKLIASESAIGSQIGTMDIGTIEHLYNPKNWYIIPCLQLLDTHVGPIRVTDV